MLIEELMRALYTSPPEAPLNNLMGFFLTC